MLRIEVTFGKNVGKSASFNKRVVRIGTSADNDFQIDDELVSPSQGLFSTRPGHDSYVYQDTKSLHGTRIRTKTTDVVLLDHDHEQKVLLSQDAELQIGRTVLHCVVTPDAPVDQLDNIDLLESFSQKDDTCPTSPSAMRALLDSLQKVTFKLAIQDILETFTNEVYHYIPDIDSVSIWSCTKDLRTYSCAYESVQSTFAGHTSIGLTQFRNAMQTRTATLVAVNRILDGQPTQSQAMIIPVCGENLSDALIIVETKESFSKSQFAWVVEFTRNCAVSASRIYQNADITDLFDGFIRTMISALDTRDPASAGHAMRVANLALMTAQAIHAQKSGPFENTTFTHDEFDELRYAALLHDVGKVSIREEIVLKAGRLLPREYVGLLERIDLFAAWFENKQPNELGRAWRSPQRFEKYRETVTRLQNASSPISEEDRSILTEMRSTYIPTRPHTPLLTPSEQKNLLIPKGTLNEDERQAMQQHALISWRYLSKILWPRRWARVPAFALQHHEKLNGSGYPYGIRGEAIFLQSRILTVCDIFDALTGGDRPYKQRHSFHEAAEILQKEVEKGAIDRNVTAIFIDQILPQLCDDTAYDSKPPFQHFSLP